MKTLVPALSPAVVLIFVALLSVSAHADKIIMKNGKIYQGHIMGETQKEMLISSPADPQPRFIPKGEILTIVHDGPPPVSEERRELATLELLMSGQFHSSPNLNLDPNAGLHAAGGMRPHPSFEVGAEINYAPAQTGDVAISDGVTTREYTRFATVAGGFYVKGFPAYRYRDWRWQPYLMMGYLWQRFMPKATTDELKGKSFEGGAGVSYLLSKSWCVEARFIYLDTSYDTVNFLLREGSLNSNVHVRTYNVMTGIAYRFL
jgi:opacity protein-like surface antigen